MAYSYEIIPVLQLLRKYIITDLTAQSEVPQVLPYLFVADQYPIDPSLLPLTCIEIAGDIKVDRTGPVNSIKISVPIEIHHIRQNDPNSVATITAIQRLSHIAASIESDWRLQSVEGADIDYAQVKKIKVGNSNPIQIKLNDAAMQISTCCVSMPVDIAWIEFLN